MDTSDLDGQEYDLDKVVRQVKFLLSPRIESLHYAWWYGSKGGPIALKLEIENVSGERAKFVINIPKADDDIKHGSFDFSKGWEEPWIGRASVDEGEFN
ncbi:MAG: hypothetical protein ISN29_00085 [Gammaproteobacteria bacterium AqS3]|nr:hypothetical protein [Gammaproteobacteria bacterium AqS3]